MGIPATEIGSYALLDINVAATAAIALFNPMAIQFDLALTGAFGLGALQADISAQFEAAASLQVSLGLQISDPRIGLSISLAAIAQLAAGLQAALSLGLPTISVELGASVSASAALSVALAAKLGGISALIELALSVKIPAVNFFAELQANLSAGPVVLITFGFSTSGSFDPEVMSVVGGQIQGLFAAGLTGILPGDEVAGIMMLTKAPSAGAAISAMFKVG